MGVHFQRIQKTSYLGWHELASEQQRMYGQRLAQVVGQQAPERAGVHCCAREACGDPHDVMAGRCGSTTQTLRYRCGTRWKKASTRKDIIEAQQKVFDANPSYQLLAIGADAPLTYFRWLFSRKLEAERNASRAA
jgi:hypothetical protein